MENMRNIDEIIKELKSHPDYLHAEVFTLGDYLDNINDENDGECPEITQEDITDKLKESIVNNILSVLSYGYEFSNPYLRLHKGKNGKVKIS
jgi:hypothetical protein